MSRKQNTASKPVWASHVFDTSKYVQIKTGITRDTSTGRLINVPKKEKSS